jgi:hypothetical protein
MALGSASVLLIDTEILRIYTDLVHALHRERIDQKLMSNLTNIQTSHLRHGSISEHRLIQPMPNHCLLNPETIMTTEEGHIGSLRITQTSEERRAMVT